MSTAPTLRESALVGSGNEGVSARVDGGAAGEKGHGLARAAVIAERREQGRPRSGYWSSTAASEQSKSDPVFPATRVLSTWSLRRRRATPPAELPLTVQLVSVAVAPRL